MFRPAALSLNHASSPRRAKPAILCTLFIVTLYGDMVEPRGRLWMGNIVETYVTVGISETLVRTAADSSRQPRGKGGRHDDTDVRAGPRSRTRRNPLEHKAVERIRPEMDRRWAAKEMHAG